MSLKLYLEMIYSEEKLDNLVNQFKDKIDAETIKKVTEIDPKTKEGFVGPYSKWLCMRFEKLPKDEQERMINDDADSIKEALGKFDKLKNKGLIPEQYKNILNVKKITDIYGILREIGGDEDIEKMSMSKKEHAVAGGETFYEDDSWVVKIPKTWEASKALARGAKWCTAADSENGKNHYGHYSKDSDLYIIIDKKSNDKTRRWQFFFGSHIELKDYDNSEIKPLSWVYENNIPDALLKKLNTKDPKKRFININNVPFEEKVKVVMNELGVTKYTINDDKTVTVNQSLTL